MDAKEETWMIKKQTAWFIIPVKKYQTPSRTGLIIGYVRWLAG